MSAQRFISITPNEQALPVRDLAAHKSRLRHALRSAVADRQHSEHLRLNQQLPEASELLLAGNRKEIRAAPPHHAHRARDEIARLFRIRVRKQDDLSLRFTSARFARPLFSEPSVRQGTVRDHSKARVFRSDTARYV